MFSIDIDVEEILEQHLAVALERLQIPTNHGYGPGYEAGFRRGFEQGYREGFKQGFREGLELGFREMILKALEIWPAKRVAELSGLSLAEVKAIEKDGKF